MKPLDTVEISWQDQEPADLLTQIGEWLENHSRHEDAKKYYKAALSLDASYSMAAWRSGQLAFRRKEYHEAIDMFKIGTLAAPDHAPTHYALSSAYLESGDYEDALKSADTAISLNPNHVGAILVKLRALAKLSMWSDVDQLAKEFEATLYDVAEARLFAILALTKLGMVDDARKTFYELPENVRKKNRELCTSIEKELAIFER